MKRKKLLLILFIIPIILIADENIKQNTTTVNQNEQTLKNPIDITDEKIKQQQNKALTILNKINSEFYISEEFQEPKYSSQLSYLKNKIQINSRANNTIAVFRDKIKVDYLEEQSFFYSTLKNIINGKKSFKDLEYFYTQLDENIKALENINMQKYKSYYESEKNKENSISKELTTNYLNLINQRDEHLFTLRYLKENINLYRSTNFFIDKFNLQFMISSIDSTIYINTISNFTSYYLKFSIGEIIVVLLILLVFRIFISRIVYLLINLINFLIKKSKYNINKEQEEEDEKIGLETFIEDSIGKPLLIAIYTLAIQICINILIKDVEILNKIVPWLNTFYISLFSWAIYSLISNSITSYAEHLVEKYPNVRREMIVFIMRIFKIVLILLVILFLFTQLGIDIKAIAASLGVGGIAIALASKDTLANFFGSLNIMTDNSFSQGDWIVANDVEGTVVDIRMRTTRIRTFDNAMITIPNSQLANTHIKNYTKRKIGRRIKMSLGVTYESKMEDIINLKNDIYEMLLNHPKIATEKETVIRKTKKFEGIKRDDLLGVKRNLLVYIDEYDSSSINILIYCFTRSPNWNDWLETKEDIMIKINKIFIKNNCDFAYPTQTINLKK